MTAAYWVRLQDAVGHAAELPEEERLPWLEAECGDDPVFLAEAVSLLREFTCTSSVLEDAVSGAAHSLIRSAEYRPGDRLGAYRILRLLGRGGMGVVYQAERADGQYEQAVAIKLLRAEIGSTESLEIRFRMERQVLARISHEHIARLLDGGITPSGLPYLVMEYVEGVSITEYAKGRRLALVERLRLMQQVCSAVQYAHQNLVIHRDLKPGNVLVTAEGRVKLLDFGIAKLLAPTLAEQSSTATLQADRMLTPEYASPEQVLGEPTTTATDVWSLGVLLYELLTGTRPFPVGSLSFAESARRVCQTAPVAPRLVRRELGKAAYVGSIGQDLDRIVLKSLHKDPQRRFSSPAELSSDLDRYLLGFPVLARPDSLLYRLQLFVRRNVWGVAAAAVVALLVVALSVVSVLQARQARQQAASADATSEYLISLFGKAEPDATQGHALTARELLDDGTARLNSRWSGTPLVKARLLSTLGRAYYQLGDFAQSAALLIQARELYRRYKGPDSTEIAALSIDLGEAELDMGRYAASLEDYRDAVRIFQRAQPESEELADAMDGLSDILWEVGQYPESERYHLQAIALSSKVLGSEAAQTVVDKSNYAVLLVDMNRLREAEGIDREVLATRLKLYGEYNSNSAGSLLNLGLVLDRLGELAEAREMLLRSLGSRRRIYPEGHPNTARSMVHLSNFYREIGQNDVAERYAMAAVRLSRALEPETALNVAFSEDSLGMAYLAEGNAALGRVWIERAYRTRDRNGSQTGALLSQSYDHLGLVNLAQGRLAAARDNMDRALKIRKELFSPGDERIAESELHLGRVQLAAGDSDGARKTLEEALHVCAGLDPKQPHLVTAAATEALGRVLLAQRDSRGKALVAEAEGLRQSILQTVPIGERDTAPLASYDGARRVSANPVPAH